MRVCLILSAPLLAVLAVAAAPVPSPPPAPPPRSPHSTPLAEDGETFAQNLLGAVNLIAEIYVRPVPRTELLQTALAGLYEAAGRPVPRDLSRRIARAEKQAEERANAEANHHPPGPVVQALAPRRNIVLDERPLLDLIRGVRAEVGKDAEREGEEPLRLCCRAMLRALDPYSDVIAPGEERRAVNRGSERDGFGLDVPAVERSRAVIRDVLPGGPAQRAGLRPGDAIIRLCDSDGRERKLDESLDVLNGRTPFVQPERGAFAAPEPITLTYRRKGVHDDTTVTLDWQHFRPESVFGVARNDDNSWNYWLDRDRKIAHLRLGSLAESTPDELSQILTRLREDGLRGLILDVRWCPGGSLAGSVKTAELFLGEGTIATVRYRNRPEDVYRSTKDNKWLDFPMVVLVNGESTGGAEMIAAALQDHHRAAIVGQRSRGKGNVQSILPSLGSVGLKVTSGVIVRPDGKNLHRFPDSKPSDDWGVRPDREYRISPDLSRALRTWWEQQTLRPGSSSERQPLDDPILDPQRNAALEALTSR
jgi:carboxyl-terminal processing protease